MKYRKEMPFLRKVLFGYILLVAVIGSMAATLLHECSRVFEIETEMRHLDLVQRDVNTAHKYITLLAMRGETALAWEEDDFEDYRSLRLRVDTMLQAMHKGYEEFVSRVQIDTLRHLLASKEEHLRQIMLLFREQDSPDGQLLARLPKEVRSKTIIRKKKGIAGLFGAKETVEITPSASATLHTLNKELQSIQEERQETIDTYTDSLRRYNKALNRKLRNLIATMNGQTERILAEKELRLEASYGRSVQIITWLVITAIVLIAASYLIIQRDLREKAKTRKRLEDTVGMLEENVEENRRLIDARRRIIQTVAHELRTPLTAIGGNAELLLDDENTENRIRHAKTVRQSAGRMAEMINSLLDYFRLDSGKETENKKPFRLDSIARILETECVPLAESKHLRLVIHNRADEVVDGDKGLILRIGSNLLSNAVKFTHDGSITLSTAYGNGTFTLTVEDTGTGMTEEQQSRIFAPFERLGNAVTEDGFGLGLAIVHDTVKLMGGDILLVSEPGLGSRFTVTLPLAKAEETEAVEKKSHTHTTLSDCNILAIDNDPVLLNLMRDMYTQSGVSCDTCLSVGELTDKMRIKDYDLLVTDLKMPEVNGYEVLDLLRSSEIGNSQTIPVVAATAAGYVTEEELKESGFAAMLRKPYFIEELMSVTEKCIEPKTNHRHIELSPLLAFGDKRHTLERLANTTETDMDGLGKAAESKDMEALNEKVHHLRSSWMLIKAEQPLAVLYETIHKDEVSEEELGDAIDNVLAQGKAITDLARKEAERWER